MVHRTIEVQCAGRGLHEITREVRAAVRAAGVAEGVCLLSIRHTSASLLISENADPSARRDLEAFFERLAPDGDPRYEHDAEGPDDMAAHLRAAVTRTSESLPIAGGELLLGTWQGIFVFEHRLRAHRRTVDLVVLAG